MHDYEETNVSERANGDNETIELAENSIPEDDCGNANHEEIVEKTEDDVQTVIDNVETSANTESDWQTPISLKGFKKKLNEIFVVK